MADIVRQSPVRFDAVAVETEMRACWKVVRRYEEEGQGPHLVDLSHLPRWHLQDSDPSRFRPCDVDIPELPGTCSLQNGVLVNRMNSTQASIWQLASEPVPMPVDSAFTDVTEAAGFLALVGPCVFSIAEKLTALDFLDPGKTVPFLLQGPICRVSCQSVVMDRSPDRAGCLLFAFPRGYGRDLVDSVLSAGAEFALCPAGEDAFRYRLEKIGR